MSSYASGYSAGKSAGRSEGRSQAFSEVDSAERKTIAHIIAQSGKFREGVENAQDYIAKTYDDIDRFTDDTTVEVKYRSWKTLWLKENKAGDQEERQIESDAKGILSRKFLKASRGFDDDAIVSTAKFCMDNLQDELGLEYERGQSALLAVSLTDDALYKVGFLSRLYNVALRLSDLDGSNHTATGPNGSPSGQSKHYEKYLATALEQFGDQLGTHMMANADGAFDDYQRWSSEDYNGGDLSTMAPPLR